MYFKIPFISDGLDREITELFRKENINFRITHKAYTLRNALSTKNKANRNADAPTALSHTYSFAYAEILCIRSHTTEKK